MTRPERFVNRAADLFEKRFIFPVGAIIDRPAVTGITFLLGPGEFVTAPYSGDQ